MIDCETTCGLVFTNICQHTVTLKRKRGNNNCSSLIYLCSCVSLFSCSFHFLSFFFFSVCMCDEKHRPSARQSCGLHLITFRLTLHTCHPCEHIRSLLKQVSKSPSSLFSSSLLHVIHQLGPCDCVKLVTFLLT